MAQRFSQGNRSNTNPAQINGGVSPPSRIYCGGAKYGTLLPISYACKPTTDQYYAEAAVLNEVERKLSVPKRGFSSRDC